VKRGGGCEGFGWNVKRNGIEFFSGGLRRRDIVERRVAAPSQDHGLNSDKVTD
jgi:hypothetical protein